MYALASNALSAKAAAVSRRSPTGDPRASSRTSADGALFAFRASVPGKKRTRAIVVSASKYDMRPVDFTATQKPVAVTSYGRASRRTNDRDFVPTNTSNVSYLTSYGDAATWDEGDCEVTLFSWRDAADRLRLVNRTLETCVTDATQECSVTRDGEMCGHAIGKAMLLLANEAVDVDEAVAALGVVLRAAGPDAAEACEAWCWRQAGTEHEPRARTFARVAARTFDFDYASDTRGTQTTTNSTGLFVNNAVAAYLRDVREECPVFHGADGACADVVDAALLMTACANVDEKEAMRVVDAILDAGEDAAMRAVQAWCVANPGATHVDAIAARVANAADAL